MAHTVLELAAGAMRSDLPIRPLLARDVPHGKAIVLAEIASVQATIHAGTTEHFLVTDSTDLERRQWHRPSGTVHRLAELGRTGQAVYPEAGWSGRGLRVDWPELKHYKSIDQLEKGTQNGSLLFSTQLPIARPAAFFN